MITLKNKQLTCFENLNFGHVWPSFGPRLGQNELDLRYVKSYVKRKLRFEWLQKRKMVAKIVLTYCEKKLFYWSRKTFEIRGWRLRFCKNLEITRTIYSNSERSKQFLKQNAFLTLSWRFLTIRIQIGKNNWDQETHRKIWKRFFFQT